jgi:pimeloyl-ACP methyl ester carboxylesterase
MRRQCAHSHSATSSDITADHTMRLRRALERHRGMESRPGEQRYDALAISKRANAATQGQDPEVQVRQTEIIDVGAARLECSVSGSGDPLVVLANAGCSTGYLESFGDRLPGSQIIAINMRGVGASRGPLGNATLHDLASDVAGVLDALQCGPAYILGHAFGNRIARCLAADRPAMVRSVILVAAGGLIGPPTPLGSAFRDAPPTKLMGPQCVALGARWLSPASDPKILASVECWPQIHIAHLATSGRVQRDEWWTGGTAPLLVIQGLDDIAAPPGNGHALRERLGERVQVVDIPRAGHFVIVEQPDQVVAAVTAFIGGRTANGKTLALAGH